MKSLTLRRIAKFILVGQFVFAVIQPQVVNRTGSFKAQADPLYGSYVLVIGELPDQFVLKKYFNLFTPDLNADAAPAGQVPAELAQVMKHPLHAYFRKVQLDVFGRSRFYEYYVCPGMLPGHLDQSIKTGNTPF